MRLSKGLFLSAFPVFALTLAVAPATRADDGRQAWSLVDDFPLDMAAYAAADPSTQTWLYQTSREVQPGAPLTDPVNYFPLSNAGNDNFGGHDLRGFWDPFGRFMDSPFVLINRTGVQQNPIPNIKWPNGTVGGGVVPGHPLVVTWKSPVSGLVTIEGDIRDLQTGHGAGVSWLIVGEAGGGGSLVLASGQVPDAGFESFAGAEGSINLETVLVEPGAKIHLYVENTDPNDTGDNIFGIRFGVREIPVPPELQRNQDAPSSSGPVSQAKYGALSRMGDPVDARFGTVTLQTVDLEVGGLLSIRRLTRSYKSSFVQDGPLGWGWYLAYGLRVRRMDADTFDVQRGDGRVDRYRRDGGGLRGPDGAVDVLAEAGAGFTLTTSQRLVYAFSADGALTAATDPDGNTVTMDRTAGRWTGVTEPSGRQWRFAYDKSGQRITSITDPSNRKVTFAYDAAGDLVAATNPMRGVTRYEYDASHRLTKVTDPRGKVYVEYAYDAIGRCVRQSDARGVHEFQYFADRSVYIDPTGAQTTFMVDADRRLLERVGPDGSATDFGYTPEGLVSSETNDDGETPTTTYDAQGRLLTSTNAEGETTTYGYDASGRVTSVTDPGGNVGTVAYDARGHVTSVTDMAGGTTTLTWTARGLLASVTDPTSRTTSYAYDAVGNRTEVTEPGGGKTLYTYDAAGRVTSSTDPVGRRTTAKYDANGRVLYVKAADGGKTSYKYDANGNVVLETSPLKGKTAYTWDDANDLVRAIDPLRQTTTFAYDGLGRRTRTTLPNASFREVGYDASGRTSQVRNGLGTVLSIGYDASGNPVRGSDGAEIATAYAYDAANRLARVTDAMGGTAEFTYDAAGRQETVKDANGNVTTYGYDAASRVTSIRDALGNERRFEYDAAGRVTREVHADGRATTYAYDAAGRVASIVSPEGTVTFGYDASGLRTSMNDSFGTTTYTYDKAGRLAAVRGPQGDVAYRYDKAGNRVGLTHGVRTFATRFDKSGRPTSIQAGSVRIAAFTYDGAGRIATETAGNGAVTTYAYDQGGRPTGFATARNGNVLRQLTRTYDAMGLVSGETGTGFQATYGHDTLGRLVSASVTSGATTTNHAYTYDAAGNRLSAVAGAVAQTFAYDAADRLVDRTGSPVTYDADGRITSDGTSDYSYDSAGRLLSFGPAGQPAQATTLGYDGDGVLVTETRDGATTTFLNDKSAPLAVRIAATQGAAATVFAHLGVRPLAQISADGTATFLATDALGSVRLATDANGASVAQPDYDPFGAPLDVVQTSPYGFAGEPTVAGGALVHMRARMYSPALGRFLTTDPAGPIAVSTQNFNPYSYVANSPVSGSDPSGRLSCADFGFARDGCNFLVDKVTGLTRAVQKVVDQVREYWARPSPPEPSPPPEPKPQLPYPTVVIPPLASPPPPPAQAGAGSDLGSRLTAAQIVANGGGNIVQESGGAKIVANGGGNLVGLNGSNVIGGNGSTARDPAGAGVISRDGAGVISRDGAGVVANGGNNVVAMGGANAVQTGAAPVVPTVGGN